MKPITSYKAYIVDFDGTLYFQKNLRIKMFCFIVIYFLLHFWKIRDLFIIRYYRKIREARKYSDQNDFEEHEFNEVAVKYNISCAQAKQIIKKWMFEMPLPFIAQEQDHNLIDFLNMQIEQQKFVIIYSDYPVLEKMKAINLFDYEYYYSGNSNIQCLKPDNKGLEFILAKLSMENIDRSEVLFIGDRFDRDGLCAQKSKIDYLILDSSKRIRKQQWNNIFVVKESCKC